MWNSYQHHPGWHSCYPISVYPQHTYSAMASPYMPVPLKNKDSQIETRGPIFKKGVPYVGDNLFVMYFCEHPPHLVHIDLSSHVECISSMVRGSNGYDSLEKIKLNKLLWDAVGSEFGGRHGLYERNYTGNYEDIRIHALMEAVNNGSADAFKNMVEQCMSEYDLDGWTDSTWINPDDVSNMKR
jgi:hypothetical protein